MFSFTHLIRIMENLVKARCCSLQFPQTLEPLLCTFCFSLLGSPKLFSFPWHSAYGTVNYSWPSVSMDSEIRGPRIWASVDFGIHWGSWHQFLFPYRGKKTVMTQKVDFIWQSKLWLRRTTYTRRTLPLWGHLWAWHVAWAPWVTAQQTGNGYISHSQPWLNVEATFHSVICDNYFRVIYC